MIPHCQVLDQVITDNTFRSSHMDGDTEVPLRLAKELLSKAALVLGRREEFLDVTGSGYNAFEALCLFYEKFHSRMIGSLLSSESHHGLGSLFLKRFFETVFPDFEIENRRVSVTTEKYIGPIPDNHESGGIIDILLETDEWMVAIENKVDESDRNNQPKQLYRYHKWLSTQNGKKFRLIYLTPSGKPAPDESTNGNDRNLEAGTDYVFLSYGQIASWIDTCTRESVRFPRIREVLVQYRDFLDQHVLPDRKRDKYMNEIEQLIKPGSFAAAEAIANALPNAKTRAMEFLLKNVLSSKIDSISTVAAGAIGELRRFTEGSATDEDPCKLFLLKQPKTNEAILLALAWDRETRRAGIGICCPAGGLLGRQLLSRFANQPENKDATECWPYWIWLRHIRQDASFFDSIDDQNRFRNELDRAFELLGNAFKDVAASFAAEEST